MLPQIIKSHSDARLYELVELPNKLQALLISDPETDKSAAAMDVKVGAAFDPRESYGLAHFLEHMLFMGTEKYPRENEFSEYINNNGGYNNAYTSQTNTNYQFECSNDSFEGALDRFAQFFIHPLFQQDTTEREMGAVDSEFRLALNNDAWRGQNLKQMSAHPDSPYNKFSIGSKETLGLPDIRDRLLKFHAQWYSANIMKLVIISKQNLEVMNGWVTKMFADVPNKEVQVPSLADPPAFDEKNMGRFFKMLPLKDKDVLGFTWVLPYSGEEWNTKPLHYVSHLFGHEGEGSLLSYLISEGLALELMAGPEHEINAFSSFEVQITLTKKGLAEYKRVIEAVGYYAKLLVEKGPVDYIFNETFEVGKLTFRFANKRKNVDYAEKLAGRMQEFKTSDMGYILQSQYYAEKFDKERTNQMMDLLQNTKNLIVTLKSRSVESQISKEDPYYGTKYDYEQFSDELINLFCNPNPVFKSKKMHLPPENNLLPKNLDIYPKKEEESKRPYLVKTWEDTDLWFQKDDEFERPKAEIQMKIYTNDNALGRSVKTRVFFEMWSGIIEEHLREFSYMAEMANLKVAFSVYHDNYNIMWTGYNDSMPNYVMETLKRVFAIDFEASEDYFNQVREAKLQRYYNHYMGQGYLQNFHATEWHMIESAYEHQQLKDILDTYSFKDFVAMSKTWMQNARYLWFATGNFQSQNVIEVVEKAREYLKTKTLERIELNDIRGICLPSQTVTTIHRPLQDKSNKNCCIMQLYQWDLERLDLKNKSMMRAITQYLEEPTFDQLRTKEALGYVVFTRLATYRDSLSVQFIAEGPEHSGNYLASRVFEHLKNMKEKVATITDEAFNTVINACVTEVTQKDLNLSERSRRYWSEIATHKYLFDRKEKEAEALKALNKEEFKAFFVDLFFTRAKIFNLITINEHHMEEEQEYRNKNKEYYAQQGWTDNNVIDSLTQYKRNSVLYPDVYQSDYAKL